MASQSNAIPLLDTLASALSQAWGRLGQRQFAPLARWVLLHVDQNGELQSATVDVLEAMPLERLVLARRGPEDEPLVIKIGRIVEAVDVTTGRKVLLDHWFAHVGACTGATDARSLKLGQVLPSH